MRNGQARKNINTEKPAMPPENNICGPFPYPADMLPPLHRIHRQCSKATANNNRKGCAMPAAALKKQHKHNQT